MRIHAISCLFNSIFFKEFSMREPLIALVDDEIAAIPYSAATVEQLRARAAGKQIYKGSTCNDHYDPDFRRRYAALLLQERGL
jgi:hypothetical protein